MLVIAASASQFVAHSKVVRLWGKQIESTIAWLNDPTSAKSIRLGRGGLLH
jgi:hypothetical protein